MSFAAFAHYGGAKELGKVMEVLFIISKNGEGSRLKVEVTAKVAPIMYEIRGGLANKAQGDILRIFNESNRFRTSSSTGW